MSTSQKNRVDLKANPFAVFEGSESPIAIHARRRWGRGDGRDQGAHAVKGLLTTQGGDGAWGGSVARTIEGLFALWLLDGASAGTGRGIDWLLEVGRSAMRHACYSNLFFGARRADVETLSGVPFTRGCSGFVKTGAALFFASVLGQGDEQRVKSAFDTLKLLPGQRGGRWCSASCGNNILQAFAAQPKVHSSEAMRLALRRLEADQTPAGNWGGGVPFYPTLYALSRISAKSADAQFRRALPRVVRLQKADGSWGHSLINTFLVLDALERKGVLA